MDRGISPIYRRERSNGGRDLSYLEEREILQRRGRQGEREEERE